MNGIWMKPLNRKPRVLHILEATLGGTLHYLKDIIQVLPATSFELSLAYASERADPGLTSTLELARLRGWQLHPVKMVRAVSPMDDMRSGAQLRKLLKSYRPDIIHCHSSKAGALGRIASLGLTGKPAVLYSPHAIAANLGRQYLLVERLLAPLANRLAAVSESERDEIAGHGLASRDQVSVIYPFVDSDFYAPQHRGTARRALNLSDQDDLIVGVGRLTEQKDPLLFVEVVRQLVIERPGLKAIWLGDGLLRTEMDHQIQQLGLQNVITLPGWQPDVRPFLAAADLLLSTSRYESFGYMIAEALAMERPAVATAVPGANDILSGELEELLYPVGDASSAARTVLQLLGQPERAASLRTLARASVQEKFSALRMREALTLCYEQLFTDSTPRNTLQLEELRANSEA